MKLSALILTLSMFLNPTGAIADYLQSDGSATVCKSFVTGFFHIKAKCAKHQARNEALSESVAKIVRDCDRTNGYIWGSMTQKTKCGEPKESKNGNSREVCVTCKARTLALCG